jgi:UDP-GlcNAc3NAcA epimerase
MKKILTVVGARPQFIKASVVSQAIISTGRLHEIVVHTGQHFDANMSEVFFSELGMAAPKYNLGIHGGSHGSMTGQMLAGIEDILLKEKPQAVMVYGDTNSTLAGALAAAKLHVPVAHVEAGLRSFNMRMPEEINRILTDRISDWLFTPTEGASAHLRNEGVKEERILHVGDVMYDVALHFGERVGLQGGMLERLRLEPGEYILVTIHRAESTDHVSRLVAITDALCKLASKWSVVFPLHPRTKGALQRQGLLSDLERKGVRLIEPVGYLGMTQLEKYAALIATDSGGVQKEAYFHRVPCVTLRDETEWTELVTAGWNNLVPPDDADRIMAAVEHALGSRGQEVSPYGNGDAAAKIATRLAAGLAA